MKKRIGRMKRHKQTKMRIENAKIHRVQKQKRPTRKQKRPAKKQQKRPNIEAKDTY